MSFDRTEPVYWMVGALAWVLGTLAASPLIGSDPIVVVAQAVIESSPGWFATWAIDTFGEAAQPVLVATVALGVVAVAGLCGVAVSRLDPDERRRRSILGLVTVAVVAGTGVGFLVAGGDLSPRWALASAVAVVPPGIVWWARRPDRETIGRRRALRRMSGAAGAVAVGGILARAVGESDDSVGAGQSLDDGDEKRDGGTTTPATTPTPTTTEERAVQDRQETDGVVVSVLDSDEAFAYDFDGMPARVGSIDDHYVVDKNATDPEVETDRWTFTVEGAVESSAEYTFEELRNHPDAREQTVTMICISNEVGGELISTTDWIGVPLRSLLAEAGVSEEAVDVMTHAEDGYYEAIPWSVIRDREDILVAVGMDGQTLPTEHGFPARLLIPGRYGMKSTKWLSRAEVATRDNVGYWTERGWDEEAVIGTFAYVRAIQRRDDRIAVGGIAFAGLRDVERVEVSLDGGETWADASLEEAPSPYAWRRWRHEIDRPDRGPIDVQARATDGDGNRQPNEEYNTDPDGSWHSVTVSL